MLYQSVGSSYCAVYATANLLRLYGDNLDRLKAKKLFTSRECGAIKKITHPILQDVLSRALATDDLVWKRLRHFSFDLLRRKVEPLLAGGSPVLLTFHIQHRVKNWSGVHCAIATGLNQYGVNLVDSLGSRSGSVPNARIERKIGELGWPVEGAPFFITRGSAQVLLGLPSLGPKNGDCHA